MDPLGLIAIVASLIGLPWLILHYITKWRQAPKITVEDERMLDDMFNLARRLEERVNTVERIISADHPDFRPGLNGSTSEWKAHSALESHYQHDRRN